MRVLLSLAVAAAGVAPPLPAQAVAGAVYHDANGNGRRDAGEPGVGGVAVSNQQAVVLTAADGGFRLDGPGTGIVFVSVPDGYRPGGRFWAPAGPALAFGLVRAAPAAAFTFIHASDTHVQPSSVARMERVRAVAESVGPAFVLVSGDLVRDALRVPEAEARGYYALYLKTAAAFPAPVLSVPGNHELFGIERHLSLVSPDHPLYARGMYRHYLGPDYYSFTYGGIHFVALNSVDHADLWYHGHVDSTQVAWLERDLAVIPRGMPVVTYNHIPFFSASEAMRGYTEEPPAPTVIRVRGRPQFRHTVANARRLLELLWRHPYPLALGGHIHLREQLRYGFAGQGTRFEQAAAVAGGWQDGPIEAESGVTVYRVENGRIGPGEFVRLDPPRR